MRDIDQFRQLMKGKTDSINTDQVIPKAPQKEMKKWTGIVVNNADPDKLGRVQIKIYGFYDDLAMSNIPWAVPDIQSWTSTKGNFVVPELNTILRGYFDNGDEMKPVYDSVAFNAAYSSLEGDFFDWYTRTEDYPHTMVLFQTDQKDYLVMNKKTGEIAFTHHTGTVMRVDSDGNIDIGTSIYSGGPANMTVNVSGNVQINSYGNCQLSAFGNVDVQSTTGQITLGNNLAKQLVNNLPQCMVCRCTALYWKHTSKSLKGLRNHNKLKKRVYSPSFSSNNKLTINGGTTLGISFSSSL